MTSSLIAYFFQLRLILRLEPDHLGVTLFNLIVQAFHRLLHFRCGVTTLPTISVVPYHHLRVNMLRSEYRMTRTNDVCDSSLWAPSIQYQGTDHSGQRLTCFEITSRVLSAYYVVFVGSQRLRWWVRHAPVRQARAQGGCA